MNFLKCRPKHKGIVGSVGQRGRRGKVVKDCPAYFSHRLQEIERGPNLLFVLWQGWGGLSRLGVVTMDL